MSVCAGQGRDLIGVPADHSRRADVLARLVELDPRNAAETRRAARAAGATGVEVVTGDASATDAYAGLVPADLVLMVGVFGNLTDADAERAAGYCARLCATGGTLIWTRYRKESDLFPRIRAWLEERGFAPVRLSGPEERQGVGAHRFTGRPEPLEPGARKFAFVGYDVLAGG